MVHQYVVYSWIYGNKKIENNPRACTYFYYIKERSYTRSENITSQMAGWIPAEGWKEKLSVILQNLQVIAGGLEVLMSKLLTHCTLIPNK